MDMITDFETELLSLSTYYGADKYINVRSLHFNFYFPSSTIANNFANHVMELFDDDLIVEVYGTECVVYEGY